MKYVLPGIALILTLALTVYVGMGIDIPQELFAGWTLILGVYIEKANKDDMNEVFGSLLK